ncbi:MAG: hypothetical protein ACTSR8_01155 [Promethearchaeota archaeon]
MMINKKKIVVLALLCSNILIPILFMMIPKVSASWLSYSDPLTVEGFDSTDPSIGFNASDGMMFYSYTQNVYENDDHEICFGSNQNGEDTFDDYIYLSEGSSPSDPMNTTHNYKSKLASDNETIYVLWQGKINGQSDFDIFLYDTSKGSPTGNIINVTDTGGDETDPSIAVVNGTIFIAYYNGTDICMKTTLGGDSISSGGTEYNLTPGVLTGTNPKLSVWKNTTDWRLDLSYIDGNNDLIHRDITKGENISDLLNDARTISNDGSAIIDHALDSSKNMAAFCYIEANDDVYVANSSAPSNPVRLTNSNVQGHPDVIIDDNDMITIFFVTNITASNSVIYTSDNYGSYFSVLDPVISTTEIIGGADELYVSSFDAEVCPGQGIFFLYDAAVKVNPNPIRKRVIYLSAFGNIYNDDNGDYQYYEWQDELTGLVYNSGWILEGIELSYTISSGNDFPIKIRLTDTVTNETWENITILDGSGGEASKITFFQPGDYFIARNIFNVEILNATNNKDLVRIEMNPLEFSNTTLNATTYSNFQINGTDFPYTIEDFSFGFEQSIFFFDKDRYWPDDYWERDHENADKVHSGSFDSNNYVDLYKFYMTAGEQYNFSVTSKGTGSNNCRISIYNSSIQTTSIANALATYTMDVYNETYLQFYAEKEDHYYFVIENLDYSNSYNYDFEHRVCPMTAKKLTPSTLYIGDATVVFSWDLNTHEEDFSRNNYEYSDIIDYNFTIFTETGVKKYSNITTLRKDTITIVQGFDNHGNPFDLPDGVYYWQVIIHSKNGQHSRSILNEFRLDTTPPKAPVCDSAEEYIQIPSFTVTWTEPSDGPFSVHHYNLYRDRKSDFTPSDSNRISIGDTLKKTSKLETNMETEVYYYKVIAVDNVGLESEPSNPGRYVVSLAGLPPDPKGQTFMVLPGDFIEYKLVDVIDDTTKDPNELYATFKGVRMQINSLIHFWISEASNEQIIPVRGNFYRKWTNITSVQLEKEYELLGKDIDLFPLVTTPDTDYQKDIFELFLKREFENSTNFEYNLKRTWYYDTFMAVDVYVHSFYKEINYDKDTYSDVNFYYDAVSFVVDARTGLVIEFTVFDDLNNVGYSFKLIDTSVGLGKIYWWLIPLMIITFLGVIAALINYIVKRLERRV